MIELLIVMALLGILAVVAVPQFHQYKIRAFDTETKSTLHEIFLSCKAFWQDTDPANDCNVSTISNTSYGFVQDAAMLVSAAGNENGFSATGQHTDSPNAYSIDSAGNIN